METGGIPEWTLWRRRDDIDESSTEVLEATLPWCDFLTDTQTLDPSTQVARAAADTSFALSHMHTCVLVHTRSCVLHNTPLDWRQAIPPAWGNIAGVRSQWPLGKLEVQTVLFSALDPPPPKIPPPQTVSHTNVWVEPLVISSSPCVRPLARARARAVWKWHACDWFCPLSRSLFYMTNSQRMSQMFQWHLAGGLSP